MSALKCPECGGSLEFAASIEVRADIPVDGRNVRIEDGKLQWSGRPFELAKVVADAVDELREEAIVARIAVRCARNDFHALGEMAGRFEVAEAYGSLVFHEGDVVWTHQNVRRTVQRIEIVRGDRIEWIDEHGERWKGRDVRSVGLLRTEVES